MVVRTEKVRLYPNAEMKQVLDELCDYRRYCWNLGLETWNNMYEQSLILEDKTLRPNEQKVRNELVANKADWQYMLSARVLQQAINDLKKAWKNFFDKSQPDWGKPKFKSRKAPHQGFKTDRAKIVSGKLRLDKPHGTKHTWSDINMRGYKSLTGKLTVVSIYREHGQYYASLPFETTVSNKPKTYTNTAIDVNVGHFNYTDGILNTFPKSLAKRYERIKHYQKLLNRKVKGSNNYVKTRTKLQREYAKVTAIQHDLIQKFTTMLVTTYDRIVIEDLNVKQMQMSHVASKGLQRSLFGYFRQVLTYKCKWYRKELILADRFYPSTQRCSQCGFVKTKTDKITLMGNAKHGTKHNEYVCYNCGSHMDRDQNAVQNLLALI